MPPPGLGLGAELPAGELALPPGTRKTYPGTLAQPHMRSSTTDALCQLPLETACACVCVCARTPMRACVCRTVTADKRSTFVDGLNLLQLETALTDIGEHPTGIGLHAHNVCTDVVRMCLPV